MPGQRDRVPSHVAMAVAMVDNSHGAVWRCWTFDIRRHPAEGRACIRQHPAHRMLIKTLFAPADPLSCPASFSTVGLFGDAIHWRMTLWEDSRAELRCSSPVRAVPWDSLWAWLAHIHSLCGHRRVGSRNPSHWHAGDIGNHQNVVFAGERTTLPCTYSQRPA